NSILNSQVFNNTQFGIYLNSSSNNIINNSQAYNNENYGIYLSNYSNNNTINNSQVYNDSVGIYLTSSSNNTINNSQSYDNVGGISLRSSSNNNFINNSQSYNNNAYGIYLTYSSNNTINNSQSYNNAQYGIYLNYSLNNAINNSQFYNNTIYGVYNDQYSTHNKYYGILKLFTNSTSDILIEEGGSFDPGSAETFPEFFSGGVLDGSGTMSCDRITNPRNFDGIYLMDINSYPTCNLQGQNTSRTGSDIKYVYGINILKQTRPIQDTGAGDPSYFSWSDLSFDSNKFIAEVNPVVGGIINFFPDNTTINTGTTQIKINTNMPSNYEITGDFIESPLTGSLIDSGIFDINLTPEFGIKNIYVIFSTGNETSPTYSDTINYAEPTPGTLTISSPLDFNLGSINSSNTTGTISGQFNDYFQIEDLLGSNTGYYTTIQTTDLSGSEYFISANLIQLKGSISPTKIEGEENSNVIISDDLLDKYMGIVNPIIYIKREKGENNGITGIYGDLPRLKIEVPPYQIIDNYNGNLIFTIYEND
ncbi:MAG: right-handed parallel beta-helix repeat-containing protein, partial [Candidatus Absconditabacterales bacterium]